MHTLLPNRQHKECVYPHPLDNTGRDEHTFYKQTLLLLARNNASNNYWQTTPNKTRTVSHIALVKTQKAGDSFVWAGFIASWFMTSPALTSQLHLGLISHVLQDLSRKAFPKPFWRNGVPLRREHLFIQYKQVFIIIHLKIPRVRTLTLFKPLYKHKGGPSTFWGGPVPPRDHCSQDVFFSSFFPSKLYNVSFPITSQSLTITHYVRRTSF